ncbi:hypothetical protein HUJ04_003137 [Dendroctonus ponderosae]|nr:hypothetical protein HUJ04_003137 [Dendroctonus ponderosae]
MSNSDFGNTSNNMFFVIFHKYVCFGLLISNMLYLGTCNAKSLRSEERLVELEAKLRYIKWDIAYLYEVRRNGEQLLKSKSGYNFYYAGEKDDSISGTGFLIHKSYDPYIESFKKISTRVIYIIIRLNRRYSLKIIALTSQDKHSSATKKDKRRIEKTRELMQERKNKRMEGATTEQDLREINRQISKAIRRDSRRYNVREIERTIDNNKSMKELQRKRTNERNEICQMTYKYGQLTINRKDRHNKYCGIILQAPLQKSI